MPVQPFGSFWIVLDRFGSLWIVLGSFWIVLGRFGSFWVVPRFSKLLSYGYPYKLPAVKILPLLTI